MEAAIKNKINILQVTQCYPPSSAGGPALSLKGINDCLLDSEFIPLVYTTNLGMRWPLDKDKVPDEVQYVGATKIALIWNGIQALRKVNIVQVSSLFFEPGLIIVLYGICLGKRIIISPRGELYPQALNSGKSTLKKVVLKLLRKFNKNILWSATCLEESKLIRYYFGESHIKIIPNIVRINYHKEVLKVRKNRLIYLGRVSPIKNIEVLIQSLSLVKDLGYEPTLSIVGKAWTNSEKTYQSRLMKLSEELGVSNQVVWNGHLTGTAKFEHISESKCLILPSFSENFGNVVIESLAVGTPVITTNGTPWAHLVDLGIGLTFPIGDERRLSDYICHFIRLEGMDAYTLYLKCNEYWKLNFGVEKISKLWLDLLRIK